MNSRCALLGAVLANLLSACGPEPASDAHGPLPGKLTIAVGTGRQGFDGDGRAPRESWLNEPTEIGFDPQGRLYIVDWNNHRLRRLAEGKLETVVGARVPGDWPAEVAADGEVLGTELAINHPMDITFGADGEAYLAAWHNHKVLQLQLDTDVVRRVAGGNRPGYAGDGGAGLEALLNFPDSLVSDAAGALVVADQRNNVIRRIAPDSEHTVSTLAGVKGPATYAGDDEPAAAAGLGLCPYNEAGGSDNPPPGGGVALDADGNLYVADTYNHCVRRVRAGADGLLGSGDPSEEIIETVAGQCGRPGFDAAPEPGKLLLRTPRDVEVQDDILYVADSGNHVIWQVDLATGRATRLVGTGEPGDAPDGAEPLAAQLDEPYGIGFDANGNLYIADTLNQRVRVLWKAAP